MKILDVQVEVRKKSFIIQTKKGSFEFPFAKLRLKPTAKNRVVLCGVDKELGGEAFTYQLASGKSDSVHIEAVLDFHRDENYLRELLLYRLSINAQEALRRNGVSKRQLARRLKTSPTQLYRLLDQTFYGKTIDQMIRLLGALNCSVDLIFKEAA